jgi:exfoliative toxin A/B
VFALLVISVLSFIFVTVKMFSLLRLKFYPTYGAFTFPYVISATAFRLTSGYIYELGFINLSIVPLLAQWLAVAIVAYVLLRYLVYFMKPFRLRKRLQFSEP